MNHPGLASPLRCVLDRSTDHIFQLTAVLAIACCGCEKGGNDKSKLPSPATVAHAVSEDQLNTIQLTPEAEKRLGIELSPVALKAFPRMRTYGGEIALPVGASIVVSAPVAGTLQPPPTGESPKVGTLVANKQIVFRLLPLLSPERSVLTPAERIRFAEVRNTLAQSQIDAEGLVQQARVQVEAAQIAVDRAQRLLREQAGTARAVDEAQAQLSLAQKGLDAALARKKLVDSIKLENMKDDAAMKEEAGTLEPLGLHAPQAGVVRSTLAAVGETVPAGAPLFEVMDFDPVWVRVPVYAGEWNELATDRPAQIAGIADAIGATRLSARPLAAPPTATALALTVDLYYELDNSAGRFRPGERVAARLPLRGEEQQRAVPWSAVVHDIQGGTWVYEHTAPQTFVRRRVQVRFVLNGWAVLEQGPALESKVVVAGAMELFGTEFPTAK